jgi:GR25 family glycosyltransferase involved in LPS biosynthesis
VVAIIGVGIATLRISLINLDRTPDRLAQFNRLNEHLGEVARFPAVDGRTLDINALLRIRLLDQSIVSTYTKGALGCALSHLALWEQTVADEEPLTICEDDAIFNRHFVGNAERLIATLPGDWDMILWGWNFDSIVSFDLLPGVSPCLSYFDQRSLRAGIRNFQDHHVLPQLFKLHRALGLVCYSLSPKGARTLRNRCVPLREMGVFFPGLNRRLYNNGIDIPMNDAYPTINAYVCFPPLVATKNEYERTTVQRD